LVDCLVKAVYVINSKSKIEKRIMNVIDTDIPDVKIIVSQRFEDE
jgi:hypothetical protein